MGATGHFKTMTKPAILTIRRRDTIHSGTVRGPFVCLSVNGGAEYVTTRDELVKLIDRVLSEERTLREEDELSTLGFLK